MTDQLADDVDATIGDLIDCIELDNDDEMATPFGQMSEAQMIGMVRPSLYQWVRENTDTTLGAVAVINLATRDILDKHAPERDRETMAMEALNDG